MDEQTQYAARPERGERGVDVRLSRLHLRRKQTFLYLFDYGDEHQFDVQLLDVNPDAPKARYPRIVESHGESPSQYGDWGDDDDDDDDD